MACGSIGPGSVPRDRTDYIGAVAKSWKEQTLLNVVRLRYGDAPTFLDVSSVISAYTFQGQLSAAGQVSSGPTATIPRGLATLGGSATYIDRPTISYTPLSGDKFTQSLLRPIPPSAIFQLIQAGYPADLVLQVTARAISGVYNRSSAGGRTREADPEFYALLDALRRLQISEVISLRLQKRGPEETGVLVLAGRRSAEVERDMRFVQTTLAIAPDKDGELSLVFGALPRNRSEIALLSRSMLEILLEIASGIDVPSQHVSQGRTAAATRVADAPNLRDRPLIGIELSTTQPANAFATVRYRDTWYWIDDDDLASKRIFTFLMLFFSLAATGVTPQAPVLTVPAS